MAVTLGQFIENLDQSGLLSAEEVAAFQKSFFGEHVVLEKIALQTEQAVNGYRTSKGCAMLAGNGGCRGDNPAVLVTRPPAPCIVPPVWYVRGLQGVVRR